MKLAGKSGTSLLHSVDLYVVQLAVREREHPDGMQRVAATTCRMVSFETLLSELAANGLAPVETGLTEAMPDFNSLMYAVVKRA